MFSPPRFHFPFPSSLLILLFFSPTYDAFILPVTKISAIRLASSHCYQIQSSTPSVCPCRTFPARLRFPLRPWRCYPPRQRDIYSRIHVGLGGRGGGGAGLACGRSAGREPAPNPAP